MLCRDSFFMQNSYYKWLVDNQNGLCTLQLVKNKKPIENQFFTFGKSVKFSDDLKTWRLPRMSKIKIFTS